MGFIGFMGLIRFRAYDIHSFKGLVRAWDLRCRDWDLRTLNPKLPGLLGAQSRV